MSRIRSLPRPGAPPRVVVVGSYADPFGLPPSGLTESLERVADVRMLDGSGLRHAIALLRGVTRAVADGYELVHLLDARLAPLGMVAQRHFAIPVTASISARDVSSRAPLSRLAMRALRHLDHGFVFDDGTARALQAAAPGLPVSHVRPAADALPTPSRRPVKQIARALRDVRPGRAVVGIPWPENRNDLRWFRDSILPLIDARPVILILGAPSRREARTLLGARRASGDFRIHTGRLNAETVAAAARFADVFAVPAGCHQARALVAFGGSQHRDGTPGLAIALAMGGIPVVADGPEHALVLAHERNAFLVDRGDEHGFAQTLNDVLSLPAVQRHCLGVEFARFTLASWPWEDVAEAYVERFASLVGRPQIPADLRAA